MRAILDVVLIVLQLYIWLLITEPLLRPIRTRLPSLGGLDISPVILILIIILIERIIVYYIYPNVI
jgi:YggT family protein